MIEKKIQKPKIFKVKSCEFEYIFEVKKAKIAEATGSACLRTNIDLRACIATRSTAMLTKKISKLQNFLRWQHLL